MEAGNEHSRVVWGQKKKRLGTGDGGRRLRVGKLALWWDQPR